MSEGYIKYDLCMKSLCVMAWYSNSRIFIQTESVMTSVLEIIKSDADNDLIYLRGSIPGSKNTTVYLRESVKNITRKTVNEKHEARIKKAEAKKGKK